MSEQEAILKYLELRKEKRGIPIVLSDQGKYYVCESEIDPWGTKVWISTEDFIGLVETALIPRKETKIEDEYNCQRKNNSFRNDIYKCG